MHHKSKILLRKKKKKKNKVRNLEGCPQKKGTCTKVLVTNPRKPNSANRWIAFVELSTKKIIRAYIPGEKQVDLKKHSKVLVRGGRVRDLPGIKYKIIRGKFDSKGIMVRRTSRSKFGTPYMKDRNLFNKKRPNQRKKKKRYNF